MKRKVFSVLLAMVMIFAMAIPTMAADDCTVTITYDAGVTGGRDYNAYKLLDVTVTQDGSGYNYTLVEKYTDIMVDALNTTLGRTTNPYTASQLIEKIGGLTAAQIREFANLVYVAIKEDATLTPDATWTGETKTLPQGYWLIADVTDFEGDPNKSNSLVMLDTAGNSSLHINGKAAETTSSKKIDDENDSLINPSEFSEDGVNLVDIADYDIGDKVPYVIDTTLAANVTSYKYFAFHMEDTASKGLEYNEDSFELAINGTSTGVTLKKAGAAEAADAMFLYEIEENADGSRTLFIYPNAGYTTIETGEYKAPSRANAGDIKAVLKDFYAGSANADDLINSANITFKYNCTLTDDCVIGPTGNPNEYTFKYSNNPYSDSWGEITDTCIVITYKLTVDKTDPTGKALEGADFTLYKFIAKATASSMTEEQAKEAGYELNAHANAWGVYEEVTNKETNEKATQFSFLGLDDGYYKLSETKTPDGYKAISDIVFHVDVTHRTNLDYVSAGDNIVVSMNVAAHDASLATFTADLEKCEISTAIINHTGAELPGTGGIGTTIFLIAGGVLVVVAVVLLVTKKRMSASK